ncbi:sulfotransferase family protein [Nocardioides sp. GCM10027113]|uniref:sulfotransferase family protein n=1 Tax=unclassified Nocardioides TaxID=2615069 RepID=UPI00360B9647
MPDSPDTGSPAGSPASGTGQRLVLVAGAGRSGTSTVAGILRRLGLHVPQPEVVSDSTNPRGFGEPQWVVDFHDDLLEHARVQVSDARPVAWEKAGVFADRPGARGKLGRWLEGELSGADQLLVKDPRLAWFLPLWTAAARHHGAAPSYLTMLRPPAEVVGSKRTYYNDRLQDAHGVAAWLNMMVGTERATRDGERTFVRYHDLLDAWEPVVTRAMADLGARHEPVDVTLRADVDAFVDPGLRRIQLTWDDLDLPDRLGTLARDAWSALDALADDPRDAAAVATLDRVHDEYADYYAECEEVSRSTVIAVRAARPDKPGNKHRRPGVAAGSPAPAATEPPTAREAGRALAVAVARRLPRPVRRLLPRSARERLLARSALPRD